MLLRLVSALLLGTLTWATSSEKAIIYAIIVFFVSLGIMFFDRFSPTIFRHPIFAGFIGMALGFWAASYIYELVSKTEFKFLNNSPFFFYILFGIAGFYFGLMGFSNLSWFLPALAKRGKKSALSQKVLDTSAIIDGRIIDVCETGFVEGVIIVPKFVLNELQQVADSTDPVKRSRGRKGLNELNRLKQSKMVSVKISEKNYPDIREVDNKLIKMAQSTRSYLVTTDYNLNKRASLEGVKVLNVNDLASSLKPVVMANEEINIAVVKEGKDPDQGIGYLDDGTMVVVDGGRSYLGKEIPVVVTSILQTAAGRMVFTQPKNKFGK